MPAARWIPGHKKKAPGGDMTAGGFLPFGFLFENRLLYQDGRFNLTL